MSYKVENLELGPMANLIYLITDIATSKTAIIDPAWDSEHIIKTCKKNKLRVDKILLTHAHHDHVNSVVDIVDYFDCPTWLQKDEINYWGTDIGKAKRFSGGEELLLGKTKIKLLHTPGHSKGSACYQLQNHIITGDTLFVFGCGHCKLEGADPEILYKTLNKMKTELDDKLEILPGHFYAEKQTSTLKEQKKGNPFLLCENKDDFIRYRTEIHDKTRQEPYRSMTRMQVKDLLKQTKPL